MTASIINELYYNLNNNSLIFPEVWESSDNIASHVHSEWLIIVLMSGYACYVLRNEYSLELYIILQLGVFSTLFAP